LTQVILRHHRRRRVTRVVRVNRCTAPWPLAISDLHSIDSCSSVGILLNPVELEGDPAVFSSWPLPFCFHRYIHR